MSCPKNPKKWLIFKYNGPHNWEVVYGVWSSFLSNWRVSFECTQCHSRHLDHFVEDAEVMALGYELDPNRCNGDFL